MTSDWTTAPCGSRTITWVVDPRNTVRSTMPGSRLAPVSPGLGQLDALRADHGASGRPRTCAAGVCASSVNSPKRTLPDEPALGQALDVEQVRHTEEVRHELRERLTVDLLRRTELLDRPIVHHGEAVGHLERLLLVVRHEDERDADLALQRRELASQRLPELGVEGTKRLVEEQHRRLQDQRSGQGHPLLLPSGQLVGTSLGVLAEPDQLERRGDARIPRPLVEVLAPAQAVRDVPADVEVREQARSSGTPC